MRDLSLGILYALLIMTLTDTAFAAQSTFKKELDFNTGGQTIGGPGIAEVETGDFDFVWEAVQASADVCATAHNPGNVTLRIDLVAAVSPSPLSLLVRPGRTKTRCGRDILAAAIACVGDEKTPRGATCEALWRVDEYHPSEGTGR